MSAWRWILLSALALACSSSDEPDPGAVSSGGSGGVASGNGAGAGGSSGMPDSGVSPASAGGAGLPSAECTSRQRRYFEDRGLLAAGTIRGLLEALDEPEAFWDELPSCSAEP